MTNQHLVIMAKAPVMGAVKTRLAADIGGVKACQFYRRTCKQILARLANDPRWFTYLAITPLSALGSKHWPAHLPQFPQGAGNLGTRMQHIFINMPPGPVIIIGSDIPAITAADIAAAFTALKSRDVVIGPCGDGGYWMIGQRRTPKPLSLFANVNWSTSSALSDTADNIGRSSLFYTNPIEDVDNGEDFARFNLFSTRVFPPRGLRAY